MSDSTFLLIWRSETLLLDVSPINKTSLAAAPEGLHVCRRGYTLRVSDCSSYHIWALEILAQRVDVPDEGNRPLPATFAKLPSCLSKATYRLLRHQFLAQLTTIPQATKGRSNEDVGSVSLELYVHASRLEELSGSKVRRPPQPKDPWFRRRRKTQKFRRRSRCQSRFRKLQMRDPLCRGHCRRGKGWHS